MTHAGLPERPGRVRPRRGPRPMDGGVSRACLKRPKIGLHTDLDAMAKLKFLRARFFEIDRLTVLLAGAYKPPTLRAAPTSNVGADNEASLSVMEKFDRHRVLHQDGKSGSVSGRRIVDRRGRITPNSLRSLTLWFIERETWTAEFWRVRSFVTRLTEH
jgi:hypothetical protein